MQNDIVPVLVVGGGPVGLALAGDLGWRGIACTLVEQSDGSIYQPRMDLVGIRTMEFCRRWGLVPAVEGSPYPRDYAQDNIYLTKGVLAEGSAPFVTRAAAYAKSIGREVVDASRARQILGIAAR